MGSGEWGVEGQQLKGCCLYAARNNEQKERSFGLEDNGLKKRSFGLEATMLCG